MTKIERLKTALEEFPTVKIKMMEPRFPFSDPDGEKVERATYVTLKNAPEMPEKVLKWIEYGNAVMYEPESGKWWKYGTQQENYPELYMDIEFEGVAA